MAIDDNTSYELTGAQVKDLASKINAKADSANLATVATSGSYNDLSNKPTIPAAQVNSDWNASSGVAQILNKPSLATVATSGSYSDLSNKPTIPTVNNATLTIQKNGVAVETFTANASSNKTANITVPTKTSDLTNDSSFVTGSLTKASGGTLGSTTIGANTANYMEVTKLSTATDLNTIKTTGTYIIAATPTNSPTGAWGTMYVDWTAGTKYQVYINDGASGNIFKRSWDSSNSVWTAWVRITSADIANIERFYRSLVPFGTAIAANKDLNTVEFLTVKKYYCSANTTVATLSNCPTSKAFMMEVFSPLSTTVDNETTGTWVYRTRVITEYQGPTWYQSCYSDSTANHWTYGAWKKYATTDNIGNATLTIQKNSTTVDTFTANASSDKTINIDVPTAVSELTNDAGYITSADVPTVNNATLTIQKNGTNVATFTANSSTNKTANITATDVTITDTDPGEGSALAANTLLGVYDIAPEDVDGARLTDGTVTREKINWGTIRTTLYQGTSETTSVSTVNLSSSPSGFDKLEIWIANSDGDRIIITIAPNATRFSATAVGGLSGTIYFHATIWTISGSTITWGKSYMKTGTSANWTTGTNQDLWVYKVVGIKY